jgi:hypothetical protein
MHSGIDSVAILSIGLKCKCNNTLAMNERTIKMTMYM